MADHKVKLVLEATSKGDGFIKAAQDAAQLKAEIEKLGQELEAAESAFASSQDVVKKFEEGLDKLSAAGYTTEDMLRRQLDATRLADSALEAAAGSVQELKSKLGALEATAEASTGEGKELSNSLEKIGIEARSAGEAAILAASDIRELAKGAEQSKAELATLNTELSRAEQELLKTSQNAVFLTKELRGLESSGSATALEIGKAEIAVRKSRDAYGVAAGAVTQLKSKIDALENGLQGAEAKIKSTGKSAGITASEMRELTTGSKNLGNAQQELKSVFDRVSAAFMKANANSIALKTRYRQLDKSGEGTKEMFTKLSAAINQSQTVELAALRAAQRLTNAIKETGDTSSVTALEIKELSQAMGRSEKYLTGMSAEGRQAGEALAAMAGEIRLTGNALEDLTRIANATEGQIKQLTDANEKVAQSSRQVEANTEKAAASLSNIEKKVGATAYAMGNILADGLRDAAQAIKDFVLESYESYRDFDDETRRVFAQMPEMSASMRDSLAGDAKVIASEIGRVPQETLPALRKALNLGISEDNLLSSIETASMAARVGGESLIDTMVLGQSVVNAYGGEMYGLSDAYDQLNYITQSSNLEFGDLNANMNEIISAAAEAGIGLDSVAGAMVTMNRQGDDAAEIGGLLSNVLTQISIEGTALGTSFKEAAGVGFREFTAAGGTLAEGLQILEDHAEATGQDLLNMVGGSSPFYRDVQAARGVLELTGKHAADLAANTQDAADATGSLAEAYSEFEDSPALVYDQAAASVENLKIAFGQFAAKVLTDSKLLENATAVANLSNGTYQHIANKNIDQFLEQAKAAGEYESALETLNKKYTDIGVIDFGTKNHLAVDIDEFLVDIAKASDTYEDFLDTVSAAGLDTSIEGRTFFGEGFDSHAVDLQLVYMDALKQSGEEYVSTVDDVARAAPKIGDSMAQFYADQAKARQEISQTSTVFFGYQESLSDFKTHLQELGEHQDRTNRYFGEATEPVENLFDAMSDLKSANDQYRLAPWGGQGELDEAAAAVEDANERIEESYRETAYEIFLAQNGVSESTIAMGVAMGIFTQVEGEARLEFANTNAAIEELILSQELLKLTDDQLIVATELLVGGLAATPEAAASAALGLGSVAESALRAKSDISGTSDALFYLTEGSPYEASASVDTGDTSSKLGAISGMLDGLNGRRTSSRHTHTNVTKNVTENVSSDDGSGGDNKDAGKSDPTPQYSGGDMFPGQAYLVGDTASGNPTPYSEILIPQQPMTNLGVVGSQALLNEQQGGSITINNHFYGPVDESASVEIADRQEQSVTAAAQQIGWVMS